MTLAGEDAFEGAFRVEPGLLEIMAGASFANIRLQAKIEVV